MKPPITRILLLAFPMAAASLLTSCVSDDYDRVSHNLPSEGGYTTYVSLPSDYTGDAYYYNNRYYAGGRYEPGTYSYQGRNYDHRYYYDGQYFYGGDYRQRAVSASRRNVAVRPTTSVDYVTYRTLPRDYSGDAYYYNNRYYAGGRYEPGTFTYQGRNYDHRYFHDGQYLYGGDYRTSPSTVSSRRTIQRSTPAYRTLRR